MTEIMLMHSYMYSSENLNTRFPVPISIYRQLRARRALYAVKARTSLAPLSRFRGSHITTAHEQQCCRFQSYAKSVPSSMKLTSEIDKA